MNELIEKMKTDKINTIVIESWYKKMMTNIQKCYFLKENGQQYIHTTAYEEAEEYFQNIHGFLWGIEATGYITTKQIAAYTEMLIEKFEF